jgi:arylsulfatase A-like enzyme
MPPITRLFASLLPFLAGVFATAAPVERPNILFILSDDQDWTGLSVRMHPDLPNSASDFYRTPNLERFAAQGMRFSAAYAPAPVCSPTRISLQTGVSPAKLGWTKAAPAEEGHRLIEADNRKSISPDETTIAEMLKTAGYATAHYGKWHLAGGGPEANGYDESDGDTGNRDADAHVDPNPVDLFGMTERATAFMEKQKQAGKPFFLQMSYYALHLPENALKSTRAFYESQPPGAMHSDPARAAITTDLDTAVGRLLESLDRLELVENTYVIYMSDNGAGGKGGLRPLSAGKGGVWEGGIRVPLIVRGPGIASDSWCHQRVVGYDFFPTFCRWAGVKEALPEGLEGGDLSPLLFEGSREPVRRAREEMIFHFPHYQGDTPRSAILLGNYKLLHFYETGETRLFNLAEDLAERNDLTVSQPKVAADLKQRLVTYLAEVGASMPRPNPDFDPATEPAGKGGGKGGKGKKGRDRVGPASRRSSESPGAKQENDRVGPASRRSSETPGAKQENDRRDAGPTGADPTPPNVVLFLIDDMGWRDVGFAGNPHIDTPSCDRLAREGMVFTQAYASAPNCAPTRACLMSGQYTPRHGVYTVVDERHLPGSPHHKVLATESRAELPTESVTIAESLRAGGYATGMIGMWNLGRGKSGPFTPTGQGFEVFKEPKSLGFEKDAYQRADGAYLSDEFTTAGIEWMEANRARPFFLYMAYHDVHAPYDPKPELAEKYRKKSEELGVEIDADYAATVEALDQNVGRILDYLDEKRLAENTIVLFTSDNGGTRQYTAPLNSGKGSLYEGGIRVPFVLRGPGIAAGLESAEPILSMDVYPTLLDFAGLAAPESHRLDGASLRPLLSGEAGSLARERVFWHFPCYVGGNGPSSAMRQGDWKIIEFFESQEVEIYDLSTDPGEQNDLGRAMPEKAQELASALHAWQEETGASRPTDLNPRYDASIQRVRGKAR